MKSGTLLLLLLSFASVTFSQGVFSNQTNAALQKVIGDYPNRFDNIRGNQIQVHSNAVDFNSKVKIPGAVNCVITQFKTPDPSASWNCDLYGSPDFEKASARFHDLYNQIRNTIIKIEGEKPFILNGQYETPSGEIKATIIRFHFLPASEAIQGLKVELSLQYTSEWTILLTVNDQEKQYVAGAN